MIGPILLGATLLTAFISGIFGMAGGLILMGVLALILPVSAAMVTHGVVQGVSNGWRAVLLRRWIAWRVLAIYLTGSLAAAGLLALTSVQLDKPWLFILLGLVPALVWLPSDRLRLNAERPAHAVFCGAVATGLNVVAGVSGPLIDVFFVNTSLDRRSVVATKAATQVLSHAVKIVYYLLPAIAAGGLPGSVWLIAALPLSIIGTTLGARLLEKMTNRQFRSWTRYIVTGIGLVYVARGASLLMDGGA